MDIPPLVNFARQQGVEFHIAEELCMNDDCEEDIQRGRELMKQIAENKMTTIFWFMRSALIVALLAESVEEVKHYLDIAERSYGELTKAWPPGTRFYDKSKECLEYHRKEMDDLWKDVKLFEQGAKSEARKSEAFEKSTTERDVPIEDIDNKDLSGDSSSQKASVDFPVPSEISNSKDMSEGCL